MGYGGVLIIGGMANIEILVHFGIDISVSMYYPSDFLFSASARYHCICTEPILRYIPFLFVCFLVSYDWWADVVRFLRGKGGRGWIRYGY